VLGATLVECNGEDDHVEYPPNLALSWLVKNLNGRSSRLLREYRPEVHGRYRSALWTPGLFRGVMRRRTDQRTAPIRSTPERGRGSSPG